MHKAGFDKVAKVYDDTIPHHIRDHYLEKRIDFIKGVLKEGLVLDVGCGTGLLDSKLENNGFKVVGLDDSKEMMAKALGRGCSKDICGQAAILPFKSNSFDLVVSIATLHHIAKKEAIFNSLKEMFRVAKTSGYILIWDHNPLNPYWPMFMKRLPQDTGLERLIPLKEISQDFKKIGAEDISVRRLGFMPDFIPFFLMRPFKILEKIVESVSLLNMFCAHNVVVAKKG